MSNKNIEQSLKVMLNSDADALLRENEQKFDKIAGEFAEKIVLAGAGEIGLKALAGLIKTGKPPIAFADNNNKIWGKTINGVPVYSPIEASQKYKDSAIFVVTVYNSSALAKQLRELNCQKVIPFIFLFFKYSTIFLPHASIDIPEKFINAKNDVYRMLSGWADLESKQEYFAQLKWRLFLDGSELLLPRPIGEMYSLHDFVSFSDHETFLDCGAFNGDSVNNFLKEQKNKFDHIIAVEPDPDNYKNLAKTLQKLSLNIQNKIELIKCAVSNKPETIRFEAKGTMGSTVSNVGCDEIECKTIDDITNGITPTIAKLDVEGFEENALNGARKLISAGNCIWIICLYHRAEDLWRIPQIIQSFSSNYLFFLRRYAEDSWEEICYAIPKTRFRKN